MFSYYLDASIHWLGERRRGATARHLGALAWGFAWSPLGWILFGSLGAIAFIVCTYLRRRPEDWPWSNYIREITKDRDEVGEELGHPQADPPDGPNDGGVLL